MGLQSIAKCVFVCFCALGLQACISAGNHEMQLSKNCKDLPYFENDYILGGNLVLASGDIRKAAVLIRDGVIFDLDTFPSLSKKYPNSAAINCEGVLISPGFINSHEHTAFSYAYPDPETPSTYTHREQWQIPEYGYYQIQYERADTEEKIFWAELRHLLWGTTTVAGSGAVKGLVKNVSSKPSEDLYAYRADLRVFPFSKDATKYFDGVPCGRTEMEEFEPTLTDGVPVSLPYIPHVSEGTNCTAELEAEAFLDYVRLHPGRVYTAVHATGFSKEQLNTLAELGGYIIWSPRSNMALYGKTAEVQEFIARRGAVALSTDWSYTGSFNLLQEVECAANFLDLEMVTDFDIWKMITINAAEALGIDSMTGSIEIGKAADLIVVRAESDDAYSDLLKFENTDLIATVVGGRLASGNIKYFDMVSLPELCANKIRGRFVCFDFDVLEYDFDQVLSVNHASVDPFSKNRQSNCGH